LLRLEPAGARQLFDLAEFCEPVFEFGTAAQCIVLRLTPLLGDPFGNRQFGVGGFEGFAGSIGGGFTGRTLARRFQRMLRQVSKALLDLGEVLVLEVLVGEVFAGDVLVGEVLMGEVFVSEVLLVEVFVFEHLALRLQRVAAGRDERRCDRDRGSDTHLDRSTRGGRGRRDGRERPRNGLLRCFNGSRRGRHGSRRGCQG
jgi:hypothetical protein